MTQIAKSINNMLNNPASPWLAPSERLSAMHGEIQQADYNIITIVRAQSTRLKKMHTGEIKLDEGGRLLIMSRSVVNRSMLSVEIFVLVDSL
jgi:hypothetical protein